MTDLLFVWAKLNPEIDYRQGLHELLAPLLYAIDQDSLPSSSTDSLPHLVLAREFVEADCWTLFSALMQQAVAYYDPRNSIPIRIKAAPVGEIYVQPVVAMAGRIYESHVQKIDPEVFFALERLEIEPQLFAVRWLRCIFGRELPYDQDMLLWDGLFAADSSLRLIEFIVVALLIRIRGALLDSDYTGALTLLLRYPSPIASETDYNIPLLILQAIYLRDNVSAAAGAVCNLQNIEVGATAGEASSLRGTRPRPTIPPDVTTARGGLLAEGGGLVGELAKGVYGRAEALGINKALFGTFNEIRVSYRTIRCLSTHSLTLTRRIARSQRPIRRSESTFRASESSTSHPQIPVARQSRFLQRSDQRERSGTCDIESAEFGNEQSGRFACGSVGGADCEHRRRG